MTDRPLALAVIAGTRPEACKLAPLTPWLRSDAHWIWTGQQPHWPAELPLPWLPLAPLPHPLTRRRLEALLAEQIEQRLRTLAPAAVLVQGDTASAYAGALVAGRLGLPLIHLEAGLRSASLRSPFPEEGYRRRISRLTQLHLTPSVLATQALQTEGVAAHTIEQVGSTAIDGLLGRRSPNGERRPIDLLVEVHRRENAGAALGRLAQALQQLETQGWRLRIALPPNARWREHWQAAWPDFDPGHPRWLPPLPRRAWLHTVQRARLLLSDSGGAAEEAPYLGTPLLVFRRHNERPEGGASGHAVTLSTTAGAAQLRTTIIEQHQRRDWPRPWPLQIDSAYGDGHAGARAADAIDRFLGQIVSRSAA